MASRPSPVAHLLETARENDIHLSETDIRTLKNALPTSKLGQWVNTFQSQHNFTAKSDPAAGASQSISSSELSTQRSILEQQSSLLSQHINVQSLTAKGSTRGTQANGKHIPTLHQKYESLSQHAYHTNVAKAAEIKEDLRRRVAGVDKRRGQLDTEMAGMLKKFDALLVDIKVGMNAFDEHGLNVGLGEGNGSDGTQTSQRNAESKTDRAEKLLKVLEKEMAKELKDRLDTIYLTTLQNPLNDVSTSQRHENDIVDQYQTEEKSERDLRNLRAEIDSLYTEITPVAAMVVDSTHGKPLRRALRQQRDVQRKQRNAVLLQTKEQLEMMTARLEGLRTSIQQNYSEGVVLKRMLGWIERLEGEVEKMPSRNLRGKTTDWSARLVDGRGDEGYMGDEIGRLEMMDDSGQKKEHEVIVNKMREVVDQRRQAVDVLVRAVDYNSDDMRPKEEEVRGLEQRIDVAKEELARVTR